MLDFSYYILYIRDQRSCSSRLCVLGGSDAKFHTKGNIITVNIEFEKFLPGVYTFGENAEIQEIFSKKL